MATTGFRRLTAVAACTIAALGLASAAASAAPAGDSTPVAKVMRPPRLDRPMRWFHWRPSARLVQRRAAASGSVAVVGLESMRDLRPLSDRYRFQRVRAIRELRAVEVSGTRAQIGALLAGAPGDQRIRYVAPVGPKRKLLGMPNDPLLSTIDPRTDLPFEWQFAVSHVEGALDVTSGSPGVLVGIIDSGLADVPDLAGKVDGRWLVGYDLKPKAEPAGNDYLGHGTAVASLIAANVGDNFGMAGFGGAAHVIAMHVPALTDAAVAVALAKLDSLGVRIVNMSFGESQRPLPILVDAINKATADGLLLVAATGNSAEPVAYPAAMLQPAGGGPSFGLAVGASNADGSLAGFSNTGDNLSLIAPGNLAGDCSGPLLAIPFFQASLQDSCYPTWFGDGGARYAYVAGTSFAAPEVAGVAALIWAARPDLKNYQVAEIIKQSARRSGAGWNPSTGCGVLDAAAALELATGRSAPGPACSTAGTGAPSQPPPAVPATPGTVRPRTCAELKSGFRRGGCVSERTGRPT